jgi:hypothetical protein
MNSEKIPVSETASAERAIGDAASPATPIRTQRGRPKTGVDVPPTVVKAIRLPVSLLRQLQTRAEAEGISLNALLQMAASDYLAHSRPYPSGS